MHDCTLKIITALQRLVVVSVASKVNMTNKRSWTAEVSPNPGGLKNCQYPAEGLMTLVVSGTF